MEMEFSDWITQKFLAWRGDKIGKGSSVVEFVKLFGTTQSLMSQWMKKGGKTPQSAKYINALYSVYGEEVYKLIGLARPILEFTPDSIPLASLPPPFANASRLLSANMKPPWPSAASVAPLPKPPQSLSKSLRNSA